MSTPLFPAEQLAAALALLPAPDTHAAPYADLVCALEVHSAAERYYMLRLYNVELALLLDGSGALISLPSAHHPHSYQDAELGRDWRETLRTLRALLAHPRVAALIDGEGR